MQALIIIEPLFTLYMCGNLLDDATRSQIEVVLDDVEEILVLLSSRTVATDEDGQRFGHTDRVRHLPGSRNFGYRCLSTARPVAKGK